MTTEKIDNKKIKKNKEENKDKKRKIWTKDMIVFSVFVLIGILCIGYIYGAILAEKSKYFYSDQCPKGQFASRRTEYYESGKVVVDKCVSHYSCPWGEEIKTECGPFADKMSCFLVCRGPDEMPGIYKPVIYLYPEEKTDVKVELNYKGEIFADYPKYNNEIKGWEVTVFPDGKIINKADNKEYSYLFWEGIPEKKTDYDLSTGFVVKGDESREFLQEILPKTGMTPKEYNEFIVYWYPIIQKNKYNLIHFASEQYTDTAPLTTVPEYDSLLRVFMVIKPLEEPINIEPQDFNKFERKGFTVVEWGGTTLDK